MLGQGRAVARLQASNLDLEAWGGVPAVSCSSRVYGEQLKPKPAGADEFAIDWEFLVALDFCYLTPSAPFCTLVPKLVASRSLTVSLSSVAAVRSL